MTKKKKSNYTNISVKSIQNEEDYRQAKVRLQSMQRQSGWKTMILLFLFIALCGAIMFFLLFFDRDDLGIKSVLLSTFSGSLLAIFFVLYIRLIFELTENRLLSKINIYEAENIKDDVVDDIFENSIKMSYKYLDQYYLQTKEQAQKGFLATMLVAGFGALLIAGGIIAMYVGAVEPSYITCGVGVITEFISAVFFYLYNKTVSSMSNYHNKLVLSHNISTALKVAESLPDSHQIEAKNLLVSELLKDINTYMTKQDPNENLNA